MSATIDLPEGERITKLAYFFFPQTQYFVKIIDKHLMNIQMQNLNISVYNNCQKHFFHCCQQQVGKYQISAVFIERNWKRMHIFCGCDIIDIFYPKKVKVNKIALLFHLSLQNIKYMSTNLTINLIVNL